MTASFDAPRHTATTAKQPINGRRRDVRAQTVDSADAGAAEASVTRLIRQQVAARLTAAARARDRTSERPVGEQERAALTQHLITESLDSYAAEQISAGRAPLRPEAESRIARSAANALLGAGGLQPLLDNDEIEDIAANGADHVFVRYADGTVERVAPIADSDVEMEDLIRLLAARTGNEERRWDRAAPVLNLQLPDGSRLNAVMAVSKRPSLSIRRHRFRRISLGELVANGALDVCLRDLLTAAVRARMNVIVAGRIGVGKTTLLRGLASAIPPAERLVTIEDTYELGFDLNAAAHPNVVALQMREANVEGEGTVDMAALFRNALRMMPDRVFVGEVRGDEVVPMLNAMSQGNDGSLSTIHASSSAGVFRKLVLYAAQAPERLDPMATNLHIAEGLDLVVHLVFAADGRRVVSSVREVVDADGLQVVSNEILHPGPDGRAIPGAPLSTEAMDRLEAHGFDSYLLQRADGWWDEARPR